jgi:hypothetical protein
MADRYYNRANTTAQKFSDDYPGTVFSYPLKRVVWHSTETNGWPGYGGGASAPTLTVFPHKALKTLEWRQHFPADMSARALRNLSGGVETNRDECVQVEIIGTCDPDRHEESPSWFYIPDAGDWFYEGLAHFAAWCYTEWGIRLDAMSLWQSYPASYGLKNTNRMTNSEWNAFRGHCGHAHVPENTHGDPGRFQARTLMVLAEEIVNPPAPPPPPLPPTMEDDMFLAHSPGGLQFLVFGLAKLQIPTMTLVNELRSCGVPDKGEHSVAMLNLFATVNVGDVGNLYQFGAEHLSTALTGLTTIQAAVEEVKDAVEELGEPTPE